MKEDALQRLKIGPLQKKLLLLLLGGAILGFKKNPYHCQKIIKKIGKEWNKINRQTIDGAIQKLYQSKLIEYHEKKSGEIIMVLSDAGKKKTLTYTIESMEIKKPLHWDKKWRMIIFDIPEAIRKLRDALRDHLRRLGFYELQKSVFVHPYPCDNEIEFLIEVYNARRYVRQIEATYIDNELHLKKIFHL